MGMRTLREHVHMLLPHGMSIHETKSLRFNDVYMLLDTSVQEEFDVLGLTNVASMVKADDIGCIQIRKLIYDETDSQFMSRFMPYVSSMYAVNITKRNVSMDTRESFNVSDKYIRSQTVMNTVNAAYFMQERCGTCGGQLEHTKKKHVCPFFCIATCQMADSSHLKNVMAFIDYNILATTTDKDSPKNTPCISVHVITPSHLLSVCFSIIDTLNLLLCLGIGVQFDPERALPCPDFLSEMPVDIMSLSTVIAFYMQYVVPSNLGERKRTAVCKILIGVGEHILRTSVLKPMIIPFVMTYIETPDMDQYYMQTPMRYVVQILQKNKINWPVVSDMVTHVPVIQKEVELQQFLSFLAPFSVCRVDLVNVFREWSPGHAKMLLGPNIQKKLQSASLNVPNEDLGNLLYGVRCFFHVNQQTFYREELQIVDPTAMSTVDISELELRFLLILFRGGLSRKSIHYERKDICSVVCPGPE